MQATEVFHLNGAGDIPILLVPPVLCSDTFNPHSHIRSTHTHTHTCNISMSPTCTHKSSNYGSQQAEVTVAVTLENHALLKEAGSTASPNHSSMLMVGDADNRIVCRQRIR